MTRFAIFLPLCSLVFPHLLWALATRRPSPAPYHRDESRRLKLDEYLVSLHAEYPLEAHLEHIGENLTAADTGFRYYDFIHTYRIRLDTHAIHNVIRHDPAVKYVEHDYHIEVPREPGTEPESIWSSLRRRWRKMVAYRNYNVRMIATWGRLPTPVTGAAVEFLDFAGEGVNVYVMDTGIRTTHVYFQRGGVAMNFKGQTITPYCGNNEPMDDTDGHGTRVAGVIKQTAYYATIVNVKTICAGDIPGDFLAAFRDIFTEHQNFRQGIGTPEGWQGSVINLSVDLGGQNSPTLGAIIDLMNQVGIPIATSAGNQGQEDASGPCGYTNVQCVASCTENYQKSGFSNFGALITAVAPGENIVSASNLDDHSVVIRSGTSLAAPHVAGVMATFVGYEGISNDVSLILLRLFDNVQTGLLGSNFAPNTVDRLVNTGLQNPGKDPNVPYAGAPDHGFPVDPNGQVGGASITATTTEPPVTTEAVPADPFEGPVPGGGSAFPSNSVTITVDAPARRAIPTPTLS